MSKLNRKRKIGIFGLALTLLGAGLAMSVTQAHADEPPSSLHLRIKNDGLYVGQVFVPDSVPPVSDGEIRISESSDLTAHARPGQTEVTIFGQAFLGNGEFLVIPADGGTHCLKFYGTTIIGFTFEEQECIKSNGFE